MELKGHVIIVTGGASGIGKEAAWALVRKGADLVVADFNEAGARAVAAEIATSGVRAHAFKVDVSKGEEVAALVDFAVARNPERHLQQRRRREGRRRHDEQVGRAGARTPRHPCGRRRPGFIDTPILGKDEAMKAALSKLHMHGKLIAPEKVASVVAFLFTDAAQAINGTTVHVDDGFLQFKA